MAVDFADQTPPTASDDVPQQPLCASLIIGVWAAFLYRLVQWEQRRTEQLRRQEGSAFPVVLTGVSINNDEIAC